MIQDFSSIVPPANEAWRVQGSGSDQVDGTALWWI
jgi:hypothetical protein